MKLRLIRIGLTLLGNALGLWIAALLLDDDMSVSGAAFVLAVVIFTVLLLVLEPLVSRLAEKYADVLSGGSALIATGLALALTDWISDGLSIAGIGTWLVATLIVWLAAALLGIVLTRLFIKQSASA